MQALIVWNCFLIPWTCWLCLSFMVEQIENKRICVRQVKQLCLCGFLRMLIIHLYVSLEPSCVCACLHNSLFGFFPDQFFQVLLKFCGTRSCAVWNAACGFYSCIHGCKGSETSLSCDGQRKEHGNTRILLFALIEIKKGKVFFKKKLSKSRKK